MTEIPRFGRTNKKIVGCPPDWDDLFEGVDVVPANELLALKAALSTPRARLLLSNATSYELDTLEKRKFNTAQAAQIYEMAIERAIAETTELAHSVLMLRTTGIWRTLGSRLANEFKEDMAVEDQRVPRRGWIATLFGK